MSKVKWVYPNELLTKEEVALRGRDLTKRIPVIPLADRADVVEGLKAILANGCGCSRICHCASQEGLRIWKEATQDEIRDLLALLEEVK